MKKNKFVKVIEHILVALPLIYVGGVASYAMLNKNAKDSYYGETINQYQEISVNGTYQNNVTYYLSGSNVNDTLNGRFDIENFKIELRGNLPDFSYNLFMNNLENVKRISISPDSNQNWNIYFYTSSDTQAYSFLNSYGVHTYDTIYSFTLRDTTNNVQNYLYYLEYNNYSFLNNALPYAMSEFNKLGFNKINFTGFFINIFHNGETNVYIDFINNYLNYMLLVETCYVLPMVLYWFIHMGEDILDRFSHKEW